MTADIAHELRTPLSLIIGHAEAVHDGVLKPSGENFEIIREEAGRLERLVDDLRTLSLADAGELSMSPELMPPSKLIQEVVDIYQHQLKQRNITLETKIESELPYIQVDLDRMTQVLTNILENSMRLTPEGGKIILTVRQAQSGIEISVLDNGPGVTAGDLERIFDRFYRTDPSRQREDGGSGLGLAIAKSIVGLHNGHIWAECPPGRGLNVLIALPDPKTFNPNSKPLTL